MQNQNNKLRAKKSLGQNFLKSIPALNKIVEAGEISKDDIVLEIGPGKGALTAKLLAVAGCVVAIEKDNNLFQFLQIKFEKEIQEKKLILLNEDILNISIFDTVFNFCSGPRFSSQILSSKVEARPDHSQKLKLHQKFNYKIIANIPYNITGAILKKFLTEKYQPELMVLMVQNEVAKRIVAQDSKESILSISVKAYGTPKMIMKVPARYFSPSPKVDSAVISIKNISREFFNSPLEEYPKGEVENLSTPARKRATPQEGNEFEQKFWEIVHKGFAHKRKKLSGNLKGVVNFEEKSLENLKNKRAEDLTLNDWVLLTQNTQ